LSPVIRNRSIYHFYGYDPRGARFYDQLIRTNIKAQSGPAKRYPTPSMRRESDQQFTRFHISNTAEGAPPETTLAIMRWERFVAETMIRSNARLVMNGYRLLLAGAVNEVGVNLLRISWKMVGIMLGLFLIPLGISLILGLGFVLLTADLSAGVLIGGCLALLVATHLIYWFILMGLMYPRFFLWGMSFYCSVGGLSRRLDDELPKFEAILDRAAASIAEEMQRDPEREFVLVGHSAGAILAIEVAGRLLEQHDGALAKRLRLITLGGAWTFLTAHAGKRADKHREYVAALIASPRFEWADVVAREDVLSVTDTVEKMPLILRKEPPKMQGFWYLNPHYTKILSYRYWRRNALNFVVMHFQYLLTPEVSGRYDYLNFIFSPWGESVAQFAQPE